MDLLLDTHVFLWALSNDSKLSSSIKDKITNLENDCWISIASFWEITIKIQIGKLKSDFSLEEMLQYTHENNIQLLEIKPEHLLQLHKLPLHHKDPFDRIIIAQAQKEKLVLVSDDSVFKNYSSLKLIF